MMLIATISTGAILVLFTLIALGFRVVVSVNDMHIVQRTKSTTSYGKDQPAGNVYYRWPAWLPAIGVRVSVLPVSVFRQTLTDYAAYDKGRVPFMIDVVGFFRIGDSNVAAQRVSSIEDLQHQLEFILKGAIRTILASSDIEEILEGRSKFGEMFTREVDEQLKQWGTQSVKCIELMDIRDVEDSKVILNIMAKKKSQIEMESRVAVAGNLQRAQVAEVNAKREVELQQQEATETIGKRAASKDQAIGIANQKAAQAIKEEEKETALKGMAVVEINTVRQAEIARAAQLVTADQAKQVASITREQQLIVADQTKQVAVISAEAEKQRLILIADGTLEQAKRHATGIELEGQAKGAAEQAVLLAPVNAQIALAKEIGSNEPYQHYLITVRQIEATQAVGMEQAKALESANVKVIANGGNVADGVASIGGLFSPKGGLQIGAALEALSETEAGAALLKRFTSNGEAKP
jgi:flotillin